MRAKSHTQNTTYLKAKYIRSKSQLRALRALQDIGAEHAFLIPPKTCQTWAEDSLRKAVYSKGGRGKMFKPGLMIN